jgi:hypothetical protein
VAVEVQHQDDAKGRLPGQTQAADNVNHAGAEPGDEAKLQKKNGTKQQQQQQQQQERLVNQGRCHVMPRTT